LARVSSPNFCGTGRACPHRAGRDGMGSAVVRPLLADRAGL